MYQALYRKYRPKDFNSVVGQDSIIKTLKNSIILGPSVASIFKVNHVYRFQLMIKYKKESDLFQVLRGLMEHYQSNQKVKIDIDFNPLHI